MIRFALLSLFLFSIVFTSSSQNPDSTLKSESSLKTVKAEGNKLSFYCKYTINYPAQAKENKIEGAVLVSFDVDSTCTLINKKVAKGLGYGCDEEALRILNEYEVCFKANNSKKCEPLQGFTMPINFKLPKQ